MYTMQSKVATHVIVFTCLISSLMGKALQRTGCFECEEEIWEEVPCHQMPSNITILTTTSRPKPTTEKPSTPKPRPPATPALPPVQPHATTISPVSATPKDPYKKCYCECKLGCKEFCRKVIVNPSEKKIVQVSKISEPTEKGRIEFTQILQREFIPNNDHNYVPENPYYSNPSNVPVPLQPSSEQEPPYAPYTSYHSEPIYGPYANDVDLFDSYPSLPHHSSHYNAPNCNNDYDFPIPFENFFSKASKNIDDPEHNYQISLDASRGKDATSPGSESDMSRLTRASVDNPLATFLRKVVRR